MGNNHKTTSNSATPVGNQWQEALGQGLNGPMGQPFNESANGAKYRVQQELAGKPVWDQQSWMAKHPDSMTLANGGTPQHTPGTMTPYANQQPNTGGLGARPVGAGADPVGTTQGFAGAINKSLGSDPGSINYSNPNNPVLQGYNPSNVGVQTPGADRAMNGLFNQPNPMNFDFNAMQNGGPSGLFGQAQQGQMGLANQYSQFASNANSNPFGDAQRPGGPSVSEFSSQGLLGDRANVASGITNYVNMQNQQALASSRARFTAMGGMGGGTPAAYAEAQTNAQGGASLANALAQADINYRNLDLGAYNGFNSANSANFGTAAGMYGSELGAVNNSRNTAFNGMGAAGNAYNNVADNEFNQQGMQFNYDQMAQNGQQANNQMNLNSGLGFNEQRNAANNNAGNMSINQGQLDMQGQQYNNQNQYNAANQRQNQYMGQGNMDLQNRQMAYQAQNNTMNNLFNSYNQSSQLGIPQAESYMQPNTGMNILNAAPKIIQAFRGGGGSSSG